MMIEVMAKKGCSCPMEKPGRRISDTQYTAVADNSFYRRLIADGSLVLKSDPVAIAAPEKEKKKRSPKRAEDSNDNTERN